MTRARAVLTTVVILGVTVWVFAPLPARDARPTLTAAERSPTAAPSSPVALDVSAFRAPLWIAPPPPPSPPPAESPAKPEPPLPALKLQILAIVRDGESDRALLYDPDADKPIWVSAGQSIGTRTVERVNAAGVEIREGRSLRTLALRTDKPAASPLERALRQPAPTPAPTSTSTPTPTSRAAPHGGDTP